jgi:hypothetical protein
MEMNSEKKSFLPSPQYKPLANGFFAFLGGCLCLALIFLGNYLGGLFAILSLIGSLFFVIFLAIAVFNYVRFGYSMFVRGGWREENKRYMESLKTKQPWDHE